MSTPAIVPIESRRFFDVYRVDGARVTHSRPPSLREEIIWCETCDSLDCQHVKRVVLAVAASVARESAK